MNPAPVTATSTGMQIDLDGHIGGGTPHIASIIFIKMN
jgi:hypothetical protein